MSALTAHQAQTQTDDVSAQEARIPNDHQFGTVNVHFDGAHTLTLSPVSGDSGELGTGVSPTNWTSLSPEDLAKITTIVIQKNISAASDINNMFEGGATGFSNLQEIQGTIDTSNTTAARYCFQHSPLTEIPAWNFSALEDGLYMFQGCTALTTLSGNMSFPALENGADMFGNCTSLIGLPDTCIFPQLKDGSEMFGKCSSLTAIPAGITGEHLETTMSMFGKSGLKSVPSTFKLTRACQSTMSMFMGCTQLEDISGVAAWDMSGVVLDMDTYQMGLVGMFAGCTNLTDATPIQSWQLNAASLNQFVDAGEGVGNVCGISYLFGMPNPPLPEFAQSPINKIAFGEGWRNMSYEAMASMGLRDTDESGAPIYWYLSPTERYTTSELFTPALWPSRLINVVLSTTPIAPDSDSGATTSGTETLPSTGDSTAVFVDSLLTAAFCAGMGSIALHLIKTKKI